jgi:hypothetical protein
MFGWMFGLVGWLGFVLCVCGVGVWVFDQPTRQCPRACRRACVSGIVRRLARCASVVGRMFDGPPHSNARVSIAYQYASFPHSNIGPTISAVCTCPQLWCEGVHSGRSSCELRTSVIVSEFWLVACSREGREGCARVPGKSCEGRTEARCTASLFPRETFC